jgi:hypothetical protein
MTAAEDKEESAAAAPLEGGDETKDDDGDDSEDDGSGGGNANVSKKRRERLEQNRISARESRKRKKTMIEELQRTVITLSRENKELNDRNEDLRSKLMGIGAKVRDLQCIHSGVGFGWMIQRMFVIGSCFCGSRGCVLLTLLASAGLSRRMDVFYCSIPIWCRCTPY